MACQDISCAFKNSMRSHHAFYARASPGILMATGVSQALVVSSSSRSLLFAVVAVVCSHLLSLSLFLSFSSRNHTSIRQGTLFRRIIIVLTAANNWASNE